VPAFILKPPAIETILNHLSHLDLPTEPPKLHPINVPQLCRSCEMLLTVRAYSRCLAFHAFTTRPQR